MTQWSMALSMVHKVTGSIHGKVTVSKQLNIMTNFETEIKNYQNDSYVSHTQEKLKKHTQGDGS